MQQNRRNMAIRPCANSYGQAVILLRLYWHMDAYANKPICWVTATTW